LIDDKDDNRGTNHQTQCTALATCYRLLTTNTMPAPLDIESRIRSRLRPLVQRLAARGVTAARVLWATLGLCAVVGALIAVLPEILPRTTGPLMLLPAALLLRLALDAMADMLLEEQTSPPPQDWLLKETGAAVCDLLLYLPLALIPGVPGGLVVTLVALGLCTEVTGLAALGIGASRRRDGPMGKSDRAMLFGLIGIILALDGSAAPWLPWLLLPASLMALVTIGNRMRAALQEIRGP
jgi:CDP-diacylglycerol--glycerol-3-phosphate 3-phosphatidyltransferase